MTEDEQLRTGLGQRLAAARKARGLTQDQVAAALDTKKGTVSAWEKARGVPDALRLARLAKRYETTADLLLWDTAPTMEAIRFAVQFDALNDRQQRAFKAMWLAYFEQAASDEHVAEHLGAVPAKETTKQ